MTIEPLKTLEEARKTRKRCQIEVEDLVPSMIRTCVQLHRLQKLLRNRHSHDKLQLTREYNKRVEECVERLSGEIAKYREQLWELVDKRREADRAVEIALSAWFEQVDAQKVEVFNYEDKVPEITWESRRARLAKRKVVTQRDCVKQEIEFAEEVKMVHREVWQAERELALGTAGRDMARTHYEGAVMAVFHLRKLLAVKQQQEEEAEMECAEASWVMEDERKKRLSERGFDRPTAKGWYAL